MVSKAFMVTVAGVEIPIGVESIDNVEILESGNLTLLLKKKSFIEKKPWRGTFEHGVRIHSGQRKL